MLPSLLTHLRSATAEQHLALEKTPCMARLLDDSVAAADVVRSLAVLHQGLATLEPPLARLGWYRPQQPALAADLERLGAAPPVATADPDPVLRDAAGHLGTAYVLVGSRLGGRTIARHLSARLGADFVARSAFYGQEPAHAGEQWSALVRAAATADPASAAAAGAAAVAAFEFLRRLALAV